MQMLALKDLKLTPFWQEKINIRLVSSLALPSANSTEINEVIGVLTGTNEKPSSTLLRQIYGYIFAARTAAGDTDADALKEIVENLSAPSPESGVRRRQPSGGSAVSMKPAFY